MQKAIELRKEILEAENGILDGCSFGFKGEIVWDNVKNILKMLKMKYFS